MDLSALNVNRASILCAIVGALLNANTLDCGMCFDDDTAIIKNGDLRPLAPWTNLLWNDFWGVPMNSTESHKSYRPLCVATFRLNYLLHELQPMGYHLVNVLLHSAVCFLYVQLCGVVFGEAWPTLIAGLLFAVHPIHTEAVAGLVGRADVLCGLFFLATLLSYRKAAASPMQGLLPGFMWLIFSLLLCVCSALSKEQGITAVVVCVALDFFIVHKMDVSLAVKLVSIPHPKQKLPKSLRDMLRRVLILVGFAGCFMALRLKLMRETPNFPVYSNPAMALETPYRQLHWSYLSAFNMWLVLAPSVLSPEYAMGTIPLVTSLADPRNLITLVFFAAVAAMLLYGAIGRGNSSKVVMFATALIIFSYLPASNVFFPVGFVVAERVLYIPSMGLCILIGYGIWCMVSRNCFHLFSNLAKLFFVCLLVMHSAKTLTRNREWYSELALYRAAVQARPNNGKMLHNLATETANKGDYVLAEELMSAATKVEPLYVTAFSDLGLILQRQGKIKEAEKAYRSAIEVINKGLTGDPFVGIMAKDVNAYTRLAVLLKVNSSHLQEAYDLCQTAFEKAPTNAKVLREIGDIMRRMKRYSNAKEMLQRATQLDHGNAFGHFYMGQAHADEGDITQAEAKYRHALSLAKNHPAMTLELASLLQQSNNSKKLQESEQLLVELLSARPANMEAAFLLGLTYFKQKSYKKAEAIFQQIFKVNPNHRDALYQLGLLKLQEEKQNVAMQIFRQVLQLDPGHKLAAAQLAKLKT